HLAARHPLDRGRGDARGGGGDPRRERAQLPGPGHQAARGELGEHAQQRPGVHVGESPPALLPRPVDPLHRPRLQLPRRRPPRRPRPPVPGGPGAMNSPSPGPAPFGAGPGEKDQGVESMVTDLRSLEQALVDGVSTERLMEDVRFLSALQRHSGTADERKAAEYVRDRLAAEGIDVTIHTFRSLLSHPPSAKLEILAPERFEVPTATRAFSISAPEGVEAELVDVDSGTAADVRRVDVKGKFALADQGGPETVRSAQLAGALGTVHIWA